MKTDRKSLIRSPRPEVLAFLDASKDTPEDDTPRLILADWLQDHGDELDQARGEYLRLETWAAQLTPGEPGRESMEAEATRLWTAHHEAWLAGLSEGLRYSRGSRGLVHLNTELRHLANPATARLAGSETLAWFDTVRLRRSTPANLSKVVSQGLLDGINHIDLSGCAIRADGVRALTEGKRLDRLRRLELQGNWIEHQGLLALVRTPGLRFLEYLDLSRNMLWDDSLASLAGRTDLHQLRHLLLGHHSFGDRGLINLLDAPWLGRLLTLDLRYTGITDRGLSALALCPRVGGLEHLILGGNNLGTAGVSALASSPHFQNLRVLDFDGANGLNATALRTLVGSSHFRGLECLSLRACGVGDEGARHLATGIHPPLRELRLDNARIGNAGAQALAEASELETLTLLSLAGNEIGSAVVNRLRGRLEDRLVV